MDAELDKVLEICDSNGVCVCVCELNCWSGGFISCPLCLTCAYSCIVNRGHIVGLGSLNLMEVDSGQHPPLAY